MSDFRNDVLSGLRRTPKMIPSKHFYDAEGSRLFEEITRLPEYYPTRTETALLARIAPEISRRIPAGGALVEFGSGASVKTRLLLNAAPQLARYVPIDISPAALEEAAADLRASFPRLKIEPIVADFTTPIPLSDEVLAGGRMGFFPGSTLGNFEPRHATAFLARARRALGEGAQFLVGIDLVKSPIMLVAAYDDAAGVTAAFNKNLLVRMQAELDSDIDPDAFDHRAIWNAGASRIEMHLVSRADQTFAVAGERVHMASGETIHTENSHKFTVDSFMSMAAAAGWRAGPVWETDPAFALVMLET